MIIKRISAYNIGFECWSNHNLRCKSSWYDYILTPSLLWSKQIDECKCWSENT